MLDRITPTNKKGAIHGVNNAVFKFSTAVFQLALGVLADNFGSLLTLWICVGVRYVNYFVLRSSDWKSLINLHLHNSSFLASLPAW